MEHDPLDVDYLPPVLAASKRQAKRFAVIILWIILGLLASFFLWASLFEINEITRGHGTIIPSQKIQIIDNLEGGIIKEILVKEGDVVEEGQLLIRIDKTKAKALYKGNRKQYFYYLMNAKRLESILKDKPFVIPPEVLKEAPEIAKEIQKHYENRINEIKVATNIAEDQIIQKRQELMDFKAKQKQAAGELKYVKEEISMLEPLAKEGLFGKRDMLRLRRDAAALEGQLDSANANIPRAESALKQAEREKEHQILRFRNEDAERLNDTLIKLAAEISELTETADQLRRTDVKSPMKGVVKDIKVDTIGGVIGPGEDLLEIVPYEDTLLVEARMSPRDIAFIHTGLEAVIKLSAYDYAIYGGLNAKVIEVSADSVTDKTKQPAETYYRAILKTDTNHLTHKGKNLPIIPGMTAEVDIITGERTILKYLMKPIIRGLQRSFGER